MSSAVKAAAMTVLASLMLVLTVESVLLASTAFGFDFRGDLYQAAHAILRGANPYHLQQIEAEARVLRAGGSAGYVASPRYPPLLMVAVIPLSLLPVQLAGILFSVLSMAAVVGAIWLLGVRDWRCIAIAALSMPAVFGSWIGNVSPLLLLGTAVIWRLRAHTRWLPVAGACVIGAKLFLWPLGAWLLVTRRYRQLAMTIVLTIALLLGSWAVIGFAGLATYPKLLVQRRLHRRAAGIIARDGAPAPWTLNARVAGDCPRSHGAAGRGCVAPSSPPRRR